MSSDKAVSVEIVAVGRELAQGDVVDTNSAFIAGQLVPKGLCVSFHTTVDDEIASLRSALATACGRARFVIVTGGIGPTDDDLTRDAVAGLCGVDLVLHKPSLAHIEQIFRSRGIEMPGCNRVQAMVPRGADVIANLLGTAAGFVVRHEQSHIFCLPGVPREMKAMIGEVVRRVVEEAGVRQVGVVRMLSCFGIAESKINEAIGCMMAPGRSPSLGTMACDGVIRLRLLAFGASAEQANELLDADERIVRDRLGDAVLCRGEESLAEAVAHELAAAGWTLATAESCTGGLVGHMLTQVPGISEWYRGGAVAYSNEAKMDLLGVQSGLFGTVGAVSPEVAEAMARGAAERLRADVGVGVTGIAGPAGGTLDKPVGLVHIAAALPCGVRHEELRLFGDRATIKDRAAKSALDMVRRALLASGNGSHSTPTS